MAIVEHVLLLMLELSFTQFVPNVTGLNVSLRVLMYLCSENRTGDSCWSDGGIQPVFCHQQHLAFVPELNEFVTDNYHNNTCTKMSFSHK